MAATASLPAFLARSFASSSGIPARLHIESVWWYAREWTLLLSVVGALFAVLELGAGFLALGAAQARSCC